MDMREIVVLVAPHGYARSFFAAAYLQIRPNTSSPQNDASRAVTNQELYTSKCTIFHMGFQYVI